MIQNESQCKCWCCQCKSKSDLLNSSIRQAKTSLSVPGWGLTSRGTASPISLGCWSAEGEVALLVTPQNAKAVIIQSWHMVLPGVLFLSYAPSTSGNTQSSSTAEETRLQWEVSSDAKILLVRKYLRHVTLVNVKSSRTVIWLFYRRTSGSQALLIKK